MASSSERGLPSTHNNNLNQQQQLQQGPQKSANTFFYEDEVFTVDKHHRVKFGVIVCSDTISDEDDEDYVDPGKVRVAWHPDGKEAVLPANQVSQSHIYSTNSPFPFSRSASHLPPLQLGLVDRTLAPGDVVRRLDVSTGQPKQFGYCQEMTVCADMNVVGTNYVIKNVPATRCVPLHRLTPGAVLLDNWIGVSDMIKEKLVLQTSCGSLIEVVLCADQSPLWDIEDNPAGSYFSTPTFHVGQILVGPVAALENATWLYTSPEMRGSRKNKTVNRKFIVQSVELDEVTIYWQIPPNMKVNSFGELSFTEPPKIVRGEDLKRIQPMNVFDAYMLQINDKHHLTIAATDEVVKRSEWKRQMANKYQIMRERSAAAFKGASPKRCPQSGCVKVVVSQEEVVPGGEAEIAEEERKFKAPPLVVTRGQSLGDDRLHHPQHHQFLTVSKAKSRSHSLESTDPPTTTDSTDNFNGDCDDETSASGGSDFSSQTVSSCSNTTTPRGSPKRSPLLTNKLKKLQQQRRKRRSERRSGGETPKLPETGQTVVARALVVYSTVTVLWQDGTLERDIPSRDLFPMHTLDHHEFFPSDFVLPANNAELDTEELHNYGVIQTMDHVGRLAKVRWFETAKSFDQDPRYKGESEVSVYDLKDHLQFQYRPGTIVARLRDRPMDDLERLDEEEDEEDAGPLGQVIDNSPEGKVKVVWVNKKVSSCWPQDIFELGNYDSGMFISHDHLHFGGDLDGTGNGDDSWMTESEESHLGDQQSEETNNKATDRRFVADSLERLKVSIVRLKMLFKTNPQIVSANVVHELMVIYKKCRYFDRLMDTHFFHEENFEGLVERVRSKALGGMTTLDATGVGFLNASHSTPIKVVKEEEEEEEGGNENDAQRQSIVLSFVGAQQPPVKTGTTRVMIARQEKIVDLEEDLEDEKRKQSIKKGDSGHYSEMDDDHSSASSSAMGHVVGIERSLIPTTIVTQLTTNTLKPAPPLSPSFSMETVCSKFCILLMQQLSKAFHEINTLYTEWEVVKEEHEQQHQPQSNAPLNDSVDALLNSSETAESAEEDQKGVPSAPPESFLVVDSVPVAHHFTLSLFNPKVPRNFYRAVKREHDMLRTGLPEGVWVRAYEERLDLFSVMIEGPTKTPYEDGVFLFDIQLGNDYPTEPPNCHYISYCHDRLNPNLYEEGRVCVSLLGTWTGKGTEKWGTNSSLLQLIVSIQGLILVPEPYFNEAGYEKQVGELKEGI